MLSFFASPPSPHSSASIKEANDHLEALYVQNAKLLKELEDSRAIIEEKLKREQELVDANESLKVEYEEKLVYQRETLTTTFEEEKQNILLELTALRRKVSVGEITVETEGENVSCETQKEVRDQITATNVEGEAEEEKGVNDETETEKEEEGVETGIENGQSQTAEEDKSQTQVTDEQTETEKVNEEKEVVVEQTPTEVDEGIADGAVREPVVEVTAEQSKTEQINEEQVVIEQAVDEVENDVYEVEGVASNVETETLAIEDSTPVEETTSPQVVETFDNNQRILTVIPQLLQQCDSLIPLPGGAVLDIQREETSAKYEGIIEQVQAAVEDVGDEVQEDNTEQIVCKLQQTITEQNERIQQLQNELSRLNDLELSRKAGILDEILKHKCAMKTVTDCLDRADQLNKIPSEINDDNKNKNSIDVITSCLDMETNV